MALGTIKNRIWLNFKNIPGWSTYRKILVIEADDYGSIRVPSIEIYNELKSKNLIQGNLHEKTDSLETVEDLKLMFLTLKKIRDIRGNCAKITPFFNPANPDFESIKSSGFKEYHYLTYSETIERFKTDKSIHELWAQGTEEAFFKPQYHGREHLNVPLFMQLVKRGNTKVHQALNLNYCYPHLSGLKNYQSLRAAYYFENEEEKIFLKNSIKDGINVFSEYFKYDPTVFCPSNGIFHDDFKTELRINGIQTIVESGMRYSPDGKGGLKSKRKFIFGKIDKNNKLINYSRNVVFEPAREGKKNSVKKALREIDAAFRWRKPAVIATHRNNFCGRLDKENRENGLDALEMLLTAIKKKWPEVEFLNSGELSELLNRSLFIKE